MDYETVTPRTCSNCKGTGNLYFGDTEEYDVQPCDVCSGPDKGGTNASNV